MTNVFSNRALPMRSFAFSLAASLAAAAPLLAQEQEVHEPVNLLSPNTGLMFWTLLIFIILLFILAKFAFKPLTAAVEAREQRLEEMLKAAQKDREDASKLLEEQKRAIDAAR